MADGIYISMNGAAARLEQLETISDNLANAQTPGFKASRPAFEAFLSKSAPEHSPMIYPAAVSTAFDLRPGAITQTQDPLDVVPNGSAFLSVDVGNGQAFTRNGHLVVDGQGTLTSAGHPVLDGGGAPISVPQGSTVRIDPNGKVFANNKPVGQLGLFTLSGPMEKVAPSVMRPQQDGEATPVSVGVRVGELEVGNSSPLEAAVQLVSAQRNFESAMQALQTSKRLDEKASEVGRVR